jgi:signal transduction histidine kinase
MNDKLPELAPADHESIDRLVESRHKLMSNKFVIPSLGSLNVIMLLTYWNWDPLPLAVIVHALLLGTFCNVWWTAKERRFRILGREWSSRDDSIDLIRWTYNLFVTNSLQLLLVVTDPTGHLITWIILGLAAQFDTFHRRTRSLVLGFAFIMGASTFVYNYGNHSWFWLLYVAAGYVSTMGLFLAVERTWVNSVRESVGMQKKADEVSASLDKMQAEALLGFQQRTISHELSNLTTIIQLHASHLKEEPGQAIKRALAKINSLNRLVLDKYRVSATQKTVSVKDLLADLDMLLRKVVEHQTIKFTLDISNEALESCYQEFEGSAYFILQNLVKNAIDAIRADLTTNSPESHEITLRVLVDKGQGRLRFQVDDTGSGMSPVLLKSLIAGEATTTKASGHGLGNKLVRHECERNGFIMTGKSHVGQGSSIWFDVPLVNAAAGHIDAGRVSS